MNEGGSWGWEEKAGGTASAEASRVAREGCSNVHVALATSTT
jgi:hypothetical protein